MKEQDQFIGFLNIDTFNSQVKNGDTLKLLTRDGGHVDAIKMGDAICSNNKDVTAININGRLLQIDIGSVYL